MKANGRRKTLWELSSVIVNPTNPATSAIPKIGENNRTVRCLLLIHQLNRRIRRPEVVLLPRRRQAKALIRMRELLPLTF